jgi:hypothetical protein
MSAPLGLRVAFAVGSRLAPRAAARRAADLWFTVPRRPLPPLPAEPPGAVTRTVEGEHGPVVTRRWGSGPCIYFMHGWAGAGDQVHGFVGPLASLGLSVVTFDSPGHGDTPVGPTGRTHAVEMARTLGDVVAAHGPAHGVVAHSLGAVATAIAIRRGWVRPDRLVLLAPVTRVGPQLERFARAVGVAGPARGHLAAEVRRHTGMAVEEFGCSGGEPQLEGMSLLAVHDCQDGFAPCSDTEALTDAWPHSRLVRTDGLGHVRLLADASVAEIAAAWLDPGQPGSRDSDAAVNLA